MPMSSGTGALEQMRILLLLLLNEIAGTNIEPSEDVSE